MPTFRGMFDDSLYSDLHDPSPTLAMMKLTGGDFGRMFPGLPSFSGTETSAVVVPRLRELGKKWGLMDAMDPHVTISNPLDAGTANPDNTNGPMTVGFTFLGQFIDHDLTFDPAPLSLPATNGPNLRTPRFDLDSVYGEGPQFDPILYDPNHRAKFLIDAAAPRDLPRASNGAAIIADPRNDENVMIAQMHLAFLRFHNRVVDHVQALNPTASPMELFRTAQGMVQWHYQHIVVNEFLDVTLDAGVLANVKSHGPSVFAPSSAPSIPREFQVACYRFGHSQVRPGYVLNPLFQAPIFDAAIHPNEVDPHDMRGGHRAFRRFLEWDSFFDFGTLEVAATAPGLPPVVRPKVKENKRIDQRLSSPLFDLPVGPGLPEPGDHLRSLAGRNLERHFMHCIPSGQAIAGELGYTTGAPTFPELVGLGFGTSTPLWYYVLKEALVQQQGRRLGKVGSRIVAEVFIGLLRDDPASYWSAQPDWVPTLPRRNGSTTGPFTMVDLLTFAGVA